MNHLGFYRTAPVCLLIVFYGFAIHFGTNPWPVNRIFALCLPLVAYVVFAHCTMMWAMNVGKVGVRQNMNRQGRRYAWHAVSVILCLMWAAAGSFIVLCAVYMPRLLGGAS
jgi:hypothetical protein